MPDEDSTPAERYADLDPSVREMLEEMRPEEVAFLVKLIRTGMSFGSVGRFAVYVCAAIAGAVIGVPALIDALSRIATWLHLAK